jgi:hypothetical protein
MNRHQPIGSPATLHHIVPGVPDIATAWPTIEIFEDRLQKVKVAFVLLNDQNIELVERDYRHES